MAKSVKAIKNYWQKLMISIGYDDNMTFNRNIKGNELRKIDGKYQSRYMLDAEFVKTELDQVSPSFCLAKWFNVSIHIPSGRTHSCYHPRAHAIPPDEIKIDVSALHNTKYKKSQRKLMLEGIRPQECDFCWQIEDSGNELSDRAYRSKDVWEPEIIEEALVIADTGNAEPRYVEVNFNQACNFRCSYCSPHLSTAWYEDVKRNGPFILSDRWHNDVTWIDNEIPLDNGPDNPYLLAFWEWLPQAYKKIQTFRMTGGEPLMDKNTFKMFDYVKDHPKENLHLSITSNCCPPGNQWSKFMTSLKQITDANAVDHFMLFCSLDSWGRQAEYIRNGMDFNQLLINIKDFLANSERHSLTFIITFNALSYSGIMEYFKNILKLRRKFSKRRQLIWFDIPQLHDPDFLNPRLLPEMVEELKKVKVYMMQNKEGRWNQFMGFSDFEVSKVQRLIDWIESPTDFDRKKAMKNFYLFFSQQDLRSESNFANTFPELEKFWNECKEANGQ
jgi:sulfatase maturation enzyme AslB (radical SAM superfamily)